MNYKIETRENIRYIQVPRLIEAGLKHCFTTKDMDMSKRSGESLKSNLEKIFHFLGANPIEIYSGYQIHSNNIELVENTSQGEEYIYGRIFPGTDGLITHKDGIASITRFADCSPIILFDKKNKAFANIHSGWKGTLERIASKGVDLLIDKYKSNPKDILGVIGPTIGKDDFEV